MDNPLKQFLPVEERSDGVYLKVGREQKEKISIQSLIKALQDGLRSRRRRSPKSFLTAALISATYRPLPRWPKVR